MISKSIVIYLFFCWVVMPGWFKAICKHPSPRWSQIYLDDIWWWYFSLFFSIPWDVKIKAMNSANIYELIAVRFKTISLFYSRRLWKVSDFVLMAIDLWKILKKSQPQEIRPKIVIGLLIKKSEASYIECQTFFFAICWQKTPSNIIAL